MDKEAHDSKSESDKIRIYRDITKRAQIDSEFRESIDNEKYMNSTREFTDLLKREEEGGRLKIAILGYKVQLMGKWDPFNTKTGLPGSEECAVYASEELARRGHKVKVYMSPPDESIWKSPFSNPQWIPEELWNDDENKEEYDMVLMWRRFDINTGRKRSKKVLLWPHDSPGYPIGSKFPNFDGVCILSEHQRRQFLNTFNGFDKIPYIICGNGIVPEQFEGEIVKDNPYSIGYFSNYARGLAVLLLIWPEIKREYPEATLSICYGRETWNTLHPHLLEQLIQMIEKYKSLGVTEYGKVGHEHLASIMKNTSVWAYSANIQGMGETFCITAIKCQAAGCIPVTTRIGALNETVHIEAPSSPNIISMESVQQYKEILLKTLGRIRDTDNDIIKTERQKYKDFAMQFTWSACIDKWLELYNLIK